MHHPSNPLARLALIAVAAASTAASAGVVNVSVNAASPWNVYMNVYGLPTSYGADRGSYVFGQYWGQSAASVAAFPASFSGNVVTMAPNTSFAPDPTDVQNQFWSFWWASDGHGGTIPQRVIESNLYVDSGISSLPLAGETVRFTGISTARSFAAPYAAYAFIREFKADYSAMVQEILVPLAAGQEFDLEAATSVGDAVQYGFALVGPNADPRTAESLGSISISAVPEPSTLALALALLGVLTASARPRRRSGVDFDDRKYALDSGT